MLLFSILLASALILAPDSEPKRGDNAVILFTEFTSIEEAMEYVIKDVLLPMDIIPSRYDAKMGYLVTERTLYKGYFNCDYIFAFLEDNGKIQIRCRPRDYGSSESIASFSDYSMSFNDRAQNNSPVGAYWEKFQLIVESIPAIVVKYHGSDEEKQIKELLL